MMRPSTLHTHHCARKLCAQRDRGDCTTVVLGTVGSSRVLEVRAGGRSDLFSYSPCGPTRNRIVVSSRGTPTARHSRSTQSGCVRPAVCSTSASSASWASTSWDLVKDPDQRRSDAISSSPRPNWGSDAICPTHVLGTIMSFRVLEVRAGAVRRCAATIARRPTVRGAPAPTVARYARIPPARRQTATATGRMRAARAPRGTRQTAHRLWQPSRAPADRHANRQPPDEARPPTSTPRSPSRSNSSRSLPCSRPAWPQALQPLTAHHPTPFRTHRHRSASRPRAPA